MVTCRPINSFEYINVANITKIVKHINVLYTTKYRNSIYKRTLSNFLPCTHRINILQE